MLSIGACFNGRSSIGHASPGKSAARLPFSACLVRCWDLFGTTKASKHWGLRTAVFNNLVPVFGVALSAVMLHEAILIFDGDWWLVGDAGCDDNQSQPHI